MLNSGPVIAFVFAVAGTAHAAAMDARDFPATGSLFTSLTAGHHALASERGQLADDIYGEFGLGFRFTERLALTLSGSRTESAQAGNPVDIDGLRLDSRWYLQTMDAWQPWVTAGIADQHVKTAGTDAGEILLTAGMGLLRHARGPLALHVEWRATYSLDNNYWDHLAGIGLTVAFGGNPPVSTPATPEQKGAEVP